MKFDIKYILKNKTTVLFFSSIIGVGLGLISSILNTRYVNPEEYGNYRYVYNIISFISSILLFGYFVSGCRLLALSNNEVRRREINGAMILILIGSILLTMILMIPLYMIHKDYLNPTVASLFLYSIPVCGAPIFLNYINTTFQGENRITGLACARLLPYVLYLPLGYLWYSNFGSNARILMLLQNGTAMLVLSIIIIQLKPKFSNLSKVFRELKLENKEYGFHVYIGSVLAVSLGYLSGITLGVFQDDNVNVGYYTLALTVSMPLSMLPSIVGTTHYKEFANQNKISNRVFLNTIIISIISLFLFVLMIVPLVKFIYSPSYAPVGIYSCFLAIGTTVHGFGDMVNRFMGAHGKGKEIRNGAIITGVFQALGSIFFVYFWGIYGAITTRVMSSLLYFLLMIFYYRITLKEINNDSI